MNDGIEFDQTDMHPVTGIGFDEHGLDMRGRSVEDYLARGFNEYGKHVITGNTCDVDGFDPWGIDSGGFDEWDEHRNGTDWDEAGYDAYGYDREGLDKTGRDFRGSDRKDDLSVIGDSPGDYLTRLYAAEKTTGMLPPELVGALDLVPEGDQWEGDSLLRLKALMSGGAPRADAGRG